MNVFECFAGIGSQYKSLKKLDIKNLKVLGICEWDMYAVLSYFYIHYDADQYFYDEELTDEEIYKHFRSASYSLNSKEPAKNLKSQPIEKLRDLYNAEIVLNVFPDVTKITGQELTEIGKQIDIFTYSFPCQDLSMAGKGNGMDKESSTRSGLLWEIERILHEIRSIDERYLPKILLMENVKSINNVKHIGNYETWLNELENLGYKTIRGIINAKDVGIPQNREREFALSFNTKKCDTSWIKCNNLLKYIKFNKQERNIEEFLCINQEKYEHENLEAVPPHTPYREKMWIQNKRIYENGKFNYPHTFTLMTKQDRIPNAGMIEFIREDKEIRYRMLSPRECFRLMGFEDRDYDKLIKKNISRERRYRLAGNSIVVDVLDIVFEKAVTVIGDNNGTIS